MEQGAILPRPCAAFTGISTHGISPCTGLAIVSAGHVFLAHIPPPPGALHWDQMMTWRDRYKRMIDDALASMVGAIAQVVIVSPDTETEMPNGGPTLINNTLNILYGLQTNRVLGNAVIVDAATGTVTPRNNALLPNQYTEIDWGDTTQNWVIMN
jgi:hypothetical protein